MFLMIRLFTDDAPLLSHLEISLIIELWRPSSQGPYVVPLTKQHLETAWTATIREYLNAAARLLQDIALILRIPNSAPLNP